MANEGIRIEMGPDGNSDDNKILAPDGRDILPAILPKRIQIDCSAGKPTTAIIVSECTRAVAVELMPDQVTVVTLGDGPETREVIAEIDTVIRRLLEPAKIPNGQTYKEGVESYKEGVDAALDALLPYVMMFGALPKKPETTELEGHRDG
jgi:hypothetical protein